MKSIIGILIAISLSPLVASAQQVDFNLSRFDLRALVSILNTYENAPTPELKTKADRGMGQFEIAYGTRLSKANIGYEIAPSDTSAGDYRWSIFVLKTEGKHPLNALARSLNKKLGVRVVFDPILIARRGMTASFLGPSNSLYLSKKAMEDGKPTKDEGHEIIHAHFYAQQKEKRSFMPKAPVAIEMFAEPGVFEGRNEYSNYLSFEEMVTYAYSIIATNHSLAKTSEDYDDGTLRFFIEYLVLVSERASQGVDKAMPLLQDKKYKIDVVNGQNSFILDSENFALLVALPSKLETAPEAYALQQMQNAKALANFNLQYFDGFENWDAQVFIEKGRKFKSAQKKFIESL